MSASSISSPLKSSGKTVAYAFRQEAKENNVRRATVTPYAAEATYWGLNPDFLTNLPASLTLLDLIPPGIYQRAPGGASGIPRGTP